jgi:hypothetical protein
MVPVNGGIQSEEGCLTRCVLACSGYCAFLPILLFVPDAAVAYDVASNDYEA